MENPPARRLRLKDKHPTMQKMEKLWALADELGLQITFWGHKATVHDPDFPKRHYDLEYIDGSDEAINEFPPTTEYALYFDNPEYLEWEEEQEKKERAKQEAERKAAEKKARKEQKEAERKRLAEIEKQERAELARLKEKYEQ